MMIMMNNQKTYNEENNKDFLLEYLELFKLEYNYVNLKYIFYNCSSLSSLPDISKWNTNNVKDMQCMFYNCSSLSSLPDISKWNTNNVEDMSKMFNDTFSLLFIYQKNN